MSKRQWYVADRKRHLSCRAITSRRASQTRPSHPLTHSPTHPLTHSPTHLRTLLIYQELRKEVLATMKYTCWATVAEEQMRRFFPGTKLTL